MEEKIKTKLVIEHWAKTAQRSFGTAKFLFQGKRYPESLFFCHLTIEKILKALVVKKTKTHAPHIHQLVKLSQLAQIKLSPEQIDQLTTITEFNIAARYNEAKFDFFQRATKTYTEKYLVLTKKIYSWFKKQLSQ